jgi:hypothetical protein
MAFCATLTRRPFVSYASMEREKQRRQRKTNILKLNKLFFECPDLTGEELLSLTKGRRLQFSQDETTYELLVHKDVWKTKRDTWNGMASILNTWSVGDQLREKMKDMPDELFTIPLVVAISDSDENIISNE